MIVALLTFLTDPVYGVLGGVSISLLSHLKRSIQGTMYVTIFRDGVFFKKTLLQKYIANQQDGDLLTIKFDHEISFLSVSAIEQTLAKLTTSHTIVFSFSHVHYIDLDGVDALEDLTKYLNRSQVHYVFCGLSKELKTRINHLKEYQLLEQQ